VRIFLSAGLVIWNGLERNDPVAVEWRMIRCLHEFRANFNRALPLALTAMLFAAEAAATDSAAFIMYHRFGESAYPSTNITLAQFDAHLAELKSGPYTVLPVHEILAAMRAGKAMLDRTVGITIDDAYLSVFTQAWPRLKKAGLPFTLFVATQPIDNGSKNYMSWDQIRAMRDAGVTIGSQTETHLHMAQANEAQNRRDLQRSQDRFKAELGAAPILFAYPYGEASNAARKLVIEQGFVAAFGQHSGIADRTGNAFFIPRFAFNERYGAMPRFRQRVNALALPVTGIAPADPLIESSNPPAFGFTVDATVSKRGQLACYHSQFDKVTVQRLGSERFEIRFAAPLKRGQSRLNCTVPGPDKRYRWFGWQFYVK
jgi:peptidoglycan/xylan/chitin deacetylase (PgdA/CDA1 family)